MKKLAFIVCLSFFSGIGLYKVQAQCGFSALGGDITSAGGTISHSGGQLVYTTNFGSTAFIIQGVQQPSEISVITAIDEIQFDLNCIVYPNPTTDLLNLKMELGKQNFLYQLYDAQGKLLESNLLKSELVSISLKDFASGNYLLVILKEGKEVKAFKIIKN